MFHRNRVIRPAEILLIVIFLVAAIACNMTQIIAPPTTSISESATPPANSFTPGDPTATPLGTDITDPNFKKGVAALDAENYEEVVSLMSAVIQSNPKLAPPYRYRGLARWFLNECSAALDDFEQALIINPDYAAAWAGRGIAHSCLGNHAEELQDYQKALSIDPSLAFVHHNLGVYYYSQGDYERSLEEYNLSVAIDPNRSGAWSGRAEVLAELGQFRECITSATRALEINPEEWLAYTDRAYCAGAFGDHMAAIDDYEIFLAHNPTDVQIWYNLGHSQYHAGLIQESVASYSQTLELDPSYYQAYINRGVAYVELEKYDEALVDYNHALEFGEIPFAYSGRGDTYYGLKMYDLAIADYEKAISMMPMTTSAAHSYCMISLTYFELGRYQDSLDAAQISNELDPSCGGQRLLEYQARSYHALGDYEQAILFMDKALQMGEFSLGYYYRGIIYHDAGKYEDAASDLNRFIILVQDNSTFEKEIADAKARLAELTP